MKAIRSNDIGAVTPRPKTVVAPSNGRHYATVVIGASQYNGGVDAKTGATYTASDVDYLCTGTDDHLVINQAIHDISYGPGQGEILFLQGTYYCAGTIDFTLAGGYGISMRGVGQWASQLYFNGGSYTTYGCGIYIETGSGFYPSNFSFQNLGIQQSFTVPVLLGGRGVVDLYIGDCYIDGGTYSGNDDNKGIALQLRGRASGGDSSQVQIVNSKFGGHVQITDPYQFNVQGNYFNNGYFSIRKDPSYSTRRGAYNVISDNRMIMASGYGMWFAGLDDTIIHDNLVYNVYTAMSVTDAAAYKFTDCRRNNIHDNMARRALAVNGASSDNTQQLYGIVLDADTSDNWVHNNDVFEGYATAGILDNGTNTTAGNRT